MIGVLFLLFDITYKTNKPHLPLFYLIHRCMRNAIISEGGSGKDIEKGEYMKCVEYWDKHAILK